MIGQNRGFALAVATGDADESDCAAPNFRPGELSEAWTQSADQVLTAFAGADLQQEVRLVEINPDGTFPAAAAVRMHLLDTVIHTWDVANRLGHRLNSLVAEHPEMAVEPMLSWCDHPQGASPLGYVAMLRYDTSRGIWRDVPGTAAIARALLKAGAPADGVPADAETPLMTAASYGDAEVAQALIEAGADLVATASADAGGVPGGTALRHAAVFGMADVAQVLLAAGATDLVQAAAAGDITALLTAETPQHERVAALRMAAEHGRLDVIDQLLSAATPVDGVDADGVHGPTRGRVQRASRQRQASPCPRRGSRPARYQIRRHTTGLVPPPARRDRPRKRPRGSGAAPGAARSAWDTVAAEHRRSCRAASCETVVGRRHAYRPP